MRCLSLLVMASLLAGMAHQSARADPPAHCARDYIYFVPVLGAFPVRTGAVSQAPAPAPVQALLPIPVVPAAPAPSSEESLTGLPRAKRYADGGALENVPAPAVPVPPVPASAPFPPRIELARIEAVLGSCVACHTGPAGKGGTTLFSPEGRFAPTVGAHVIYESVRSGAMPKQGPKLSPQDVELLRQWASETNPR